MRCHECSGSCDAVADLRDQLEPFAGRVADGAMAAFFLGGVAHTLGKLALAGGDTAIGTTEV
jgi:hypothetical protein